MSRSRKRLRYRYPATRSPDIRKVCAEDASLEVAVLYDPAFIYVIDEFYFCKHLQAILYAVEYAAYVRNLISLYNDFSLFAPVVLHIVPQGCESWGFAPVVGFT